MNDNRKFWQRFARLYGPFMKNNAGLYQKLCEKTAETLTVDMKVLELACGTGQLSFPLADRVKEWHATDFSSAMIGEAKKRKAPPQLTFSVEDATALSFEADRFDAVVIANALHIMPYPQKALKEIRRVLKPGGVLYAPTFTRGKTAAARIRIRLIGLAGFRTYSSWEPEELKQEIGAAGFSVCECEVLESRLLPLCWTRAVKKQDSTAQ